MTAPAPEGLERLRECPLCKQSMLESYAFGASGNAEVVGYQHPWSPEETCALKHHVVWRRDYKAWNTRPSAPAEAMLHAIAEAVYLHIDWKASREEALRVVRLAADAPPPALTKEMVERAARALCCGNECVRPDDCWAIKRGRYDERKRARAALAAGLGEKERDR